MLCQDTGVAVWLLFLSLVMDEDGVDGGYYLYLISTLSNICYQLYFMITSGWYNNRSRNILLKNYTYFRNLTLLITLAVCHFLEYLWILLFFPIDIFSTIRKFMNCFCTSMSMRKGSHPTSLILIINSNLSLRIGSFSFS